MAMHNDAPTVAAQQCGVTPAEAGGLVDAQTEARAIAEKLQDLVDGTDGWLNVDKAAGIIATALAAKDAELATVKVSNNKWLSKWERAEAQLAEARKALGMMLKEHDILSGNFGDVMDPKHKRPDRWPTAAEAARRALEGGQEE